MTGRVPSKLIDWDLELLHATEALRVIDAASFTTSPEKGLPTLRCYGV
jgi:hypothetical protein